MDFIYSTPKKLNAGQTGHMQSKLSWQNKLHNQATEKNNSNVNHSEFLKPKHYLMTVNEHVIFTR